MKHTVVGVAALRLSAELRAIGQDQAIGQRDVHQRLAGLSRRRRQGLLKRHLEGLCGFVPVGRDRDGRRARLAVPQRELLQVAATGFGKTGEEILDCRGVAVVPFEIEIHALAEILGPQDGADHAHHFRAFFIHCCSVEIVDFLVGFRPNRVRKRAGILGKLVGFQQPDLGNALDCGRALVSRKRVIAVNGEAFLQAQLKPVAAGNAVAGPVVEILMCNDGFDIGVIGIGRGFRIGEHIFVVEDIEPLVFHRAHVEIRHGDDLENVEIIFAAEDLLIPLHGALERIHGITGAVFLAVFDIDLECHFAAAHGSEAVFDQAEIATHQRKQVGRFRMRVEPGGEMPAFVVIAAAEKIAVRQKVFRIVLAGDDGDGIDGQHIRPVIEIGDAAETFRLALGAIDPVGAVKPHQLGVGVGGKRGIDGNLERLAFGQVADGQAFIGHIIERRIDFIAVKLQAVEGQLVPVKHQSRI